MTDDLWRSGAADLARLIRDKEVSSREVVQAHLDRIAQVNPKLNAVTEVLEETALEAAAAADAAIAGGEDVGPLHGVPFTVKVNVDVAGSATTAGMPLFADARPAADAPVVARLRVAGAIPLARTNMPDGGMRWHTASSLHGATLNPWNPALTPGGSSGGEGAALATGMTPLGIGNDIGGSVRWPSQCCGVTALRPTLGRVPHHSSTIDIELSISYQMFFAQGPMARQVRDLRLALQAMSGSDARDPWSVPAPLEGSGRSDRVGPHFERDRRGPLRVAVTTDPGGLGVDPAIAGGVRDAARALADAGCVVEEVDPPVVAEAHDLWGALLAAESRAMVLPLLGQLLSEEASTIFHFLVDSFPACDLAGYVEALARRNRLARDWALFLERHDVILGPASCAQPFAAGADLSSKDVFAKILLGMRLITAVNLLGLPAAVVPVGVADGLPLAAQIIGARFREDLCLQAAEAIEDRLGVITPIDPQSNGLPSTPSRAT